MTMMILSGILGGLGIVGMISRKTLLGLMIGAQFLILGATMAFVSAGILSGMRVDGYVFGLFITLGGMAQLAVAYALSIRLFFVKKRVDLSEIQALKQ